MNCYLGGYFLIKLSPLTWSYKSGDAVYTCSGCVNENMIGAWSYSWMNRDEELNSIKRTYNIDDDDVKLIRNWVDTNWEKGKIKPDSVFSEIEIAMEYKNAFFPHLNGINLSGLYFDETETNKILEEFRPTASMEIGIYPILSEKILEEDNGKVLGYDLISMYELTTQFCSFWCNDVGRELADRFGLNLNENGLFDNCLNWGEVLQLLNDPKFGCESCPWHVTKVKMIEI
ncbi:MAG: hypothetical protein LBL35_02765 [Clostridiales bacterium]|jgi:hypothetical protein|nr:hypothetical protein [Clostridiales bacterium]